MRPRIFRNFGTKVLSIGLAALLWGLVAGQREAERSLRVPLEYRNIPPELELLGEPASLVDVRVRGSSGVLGELRGADLVAVLDLRTARPGRRLFHLLPDDIAVPAGVKVLQATPSPLQVVKPPPPVWHEYERQPVPRPRQWAPVLHSMRQGGARHSTSHVAPAEQTMTLWPPTET